MKTLTRNALIVVISTTIVTLIIGLVGAVKANAVMIEAPERTVANLHVVYAEPIPARGKETRVYFELNDGSAWGYRGYGPCARANKVPNRICRTVFWYAR